MKDFAEDFIDWLICDAPLWAQIGVVALVIPLAFVLMLAVVSIIALVAYGYWIILPLLLAAFIWAVLHAYGKSKGGEE
jgi:hypothetical protein